MSRRIKTARGKTIDMAALGAKNEKVRAVGNILMNARGDRLNQDGSVKYTAEEIARTAQDLRQPSAQSAISDPKPISQPAQQPITDPFEEEAAPDPISKITKTRDDGSQYMEIEYDDGTIETIELQSKEE